MRGETGRNKHGHVGVLDFTMAKEKLLLNSLNFTNEKKFLLILTCKNIRKHFN